MGQVLQKLLDAVGIANQPLPSQDSHLAIALNSARAHMAQTGLPYAFVVRKGQIGGAISAPPPRATEPLSLPVPADSLAASPPTRFGVLSRLIEILPREAALIATTGKTGRELFTIADREQHLYLVGSMGCASAVGLGVALHVDRPVVVLDGDGAALMKLGNFATIGAQKPRHLIHILLDNGVHDSTGGQATASPGVDFAAIAAASGYRSAVTAAGLEAVSSAIGRAVAAPGPHFLRTSIAAGSIEQLGRPSIAPSVVARRFRRFLTGEDEAHLPHAQPPMTTIA
jgi:phosphonopyruvate decarboxylase